MSKSPPVGARRQPRFNAPGNPLYGGPDLTHPPTNKSGILPGALQKRGVEIWSERKAQAFRTNAAGTAQVWTYNTPVFDMHPGASAASGMPQNAFPINHDSSYGLSVYLVMILGGGVGAIPWALRFGLTATYWEVGSAISSQAAELLQLTQAVPVTTQIQSGATVAAGAYQPASPLSFEPCVTGLRFWQVFLQVTIAQVAPIADPYFIQAGLH